MIELRRVTEPVEINCPHCGAPIYAAHEHTTRMLGAGSWLDDGDIVPGLYQALKPEQREPDGFYCHLGTGSRPCCGKQYIVITATFVNTSPDDDFRDTYFRLNGDRGEETNFIARRAEFSWLVSRFESPLGPVLAHERGPFPWEDKSWIGPYGVAACADGNDTPWQFARELLVELGVAARFVQNCTLSGISASLHGSDVSAPRWRRALSAT